MKGTGCQAAAELTTTRAPRAARDHPRQDVGGQVDHGDAVEAHHLDLALPVQRPERAVGAEARR